MLSPLRWDRFMPTAIWLRVAGRMASSDQTTPERRERARDAGLARGVGVFGLAMAIVNGVVGGGIFSLPADMAHAAGPAALLGYLVCALAMTGVVLCCAEAGSRLPTSGGLYGYIEEAFGPLAGFVGGALLWLSSVLAAGGIAAALTDSLGALRPELHNGAARAALIIGELGLVAVINCFSVRFASRAIGVFTALKLVPLIAFVAIGVAYIDPHRLGVGAAPAVSGVGRAVILSLFAFQGMETPLAASGEVRDPTRTLPRALLAAMAAVAVLYIAIQLICQGLLGDALAGSKNPLADALSRVDPRLGLLMLATAAASRMIWLGSDALGSPRVLFAFARDGFLPSVIGGLSRGAATPVVAIGVHAVIAMGLALSGTFEQLAVLSVLSSAILYIGACAAAVVLRRRGVAVAGAPLRVSGLWLWAALGIASMVAVIALARGVEIMAMVAASLGAAVLFLVTAPARRRRAAQSAAP